MHAGQALQRVLLIATLHDLSASFLTQPIEREDLRRDVDGTQWTAGRSQMLIRLGYARRAVSAAPRRDVSDMLDIV